LSLPAKPQKKIIYESTPVPSGMESDISSQMLAKLVFDKEKNIFSRLNVLIRNAIRINTCQKVNKEDFRNQIIIPLPRN
jgi:hypothetical protein